MPSFDMYDKKDSIDFQVIHFLVKHYSARFEIPDSNLILRNWDEPFKNRMILELIRKVAFIECHEPLEVEVPASWWQHLKATMYQKRWFPRWIANRYPVRFEIWRYKAEAMFPNLPIVADRTSFEVGWFQWNTKRIEP